MKKFLVMDVDGTLTDGKIYMAADRELFKAFDIKDGCGIKDILPEYGIIPVIITARESKILARRCAELGITFLYQNAQNKLTKLQEVLRQYNEEYASDYTYKDIAYIGDDIKDIPCMEAVKAAGGLVGCPQDAVETVCDIADYVCQKRAGEGAVREFIEFLTRTGEKEVMSVEERIENAIRYLSELDLKTLPAGTYHVDENFYYMVQEYRTKPEKDGRLESHRKYVDIQWMIQGTEKIVSMDISRLEAETGYDSEKDVIFWKERPDMTRTILRDGSYMVFFPRDAHKPGIAEGALQNVKKVVAKVKVDGFKA